MNRSADHLDEVADALRAIGNAARGEAVRRDRGSELEHLGVPVPALRRRVRQGFSFSGLPETEIMEIWDRIWRTSPYGDVLFAALEYYLPAARRGAATGTWDVVRHWHGRVDNWCHSDMLGNLYSWLLASDFDAVYPQLRRWNEADVLWPRRISLTSLIHNTGKNAAFLAPERVLPLVANCVDDHRRYVGLAAGWVLREMDRAHPGEVTEFLYRHAARMSGEALGRATERRPAPDRVAWRALRRDSRQA
ncbi:MAG: DNA alkylation repair protein [Nocardioides sp.]